MFETLFAFFVPAILIAASVLLVLNRPGLRPVRIKTRQRKRR